MDGSGTHAMPARSMRARSGLWILVRDAMRGRRDEERGAVPFKVARGRGNCQRPSACDHQQSS